MGDGRQAGGVDGRRRWEMEVADVRWWCQTGVVGGWVTADDRREEEVVHGARQEVCAVCERWHRCQTVRTRGITQGGRAGR